MESTYSRNGDLVLDVAWSDTHVHTFNRSFTSGYNLVSGANIRTQHYLASHIFDSHTIMLER